MSTKTTTTIKLLNVNYDIKCDESDVTRLLGSADYLNEKLKIVQKRGQNNLSNILLLTALILSGEVIDSRKKNDTGIESMSDCLKELHLKIQSVIQAEESRVDEELIEKKEEKMEIEKPEMLNTKA